MRGLMKLAGVARFDCVGSTQEFTCYRAGLASPGDHTCGWTTSTLHSHCAWRYWFRWGCGASSTTSVIADLAGGHILYPRSTGPDHAALHPIRRGAMPTDRVHRRPQQAQPRAIPPHKPLPSASNAATRPRHAHPGSEREALHQLASITPPPSWCNTPLRGVTPARNKQQCGYALQHASQYARQAAQRRLRRRFTTEKQAPATRPLTAALISCLDTAPTEPDALASISFGCAGTAMPSAGS